jgi:hypothetical protein
MKTKGGNSNTGIPGEEEYRERRKSPQKMPGAP